MSHSYPRFPLSGDESSLQERIHKALEIAWDYANTDGAHHKQWTINEMVNALTGGNFEDLKELYEAELPDGDWYEWDEGIAP